MAYAHLKLMRTPIPLLPGEIGFPASRPAMIAAYTRAFPLQVRSRQEQNLIAPKIISISRRDAMLYMTAEVLSGFTLLSAEPAEARIGKLERKRKIMEKLEKLREEAGISKLKTENRVTPPTPPPPPPPRPMNPQQPSVRPLAEATLP